MMQDNPKTYYDVIIIGGGISGLTSAALFGKFGISSCVFEMSENPGGYLAGFNRKGFKFDTAIHWLNDCSTNGIVSKIFRIINEDFPKAETQHDIRRFINEKSNYLFTSDPEKLKAELTSEFPDEKKGLDKFFRDAKRISTSFNDYIDLGRSAETRSLFGKMFYGLKMLKFAFPFFPHLKYSGNEAVSKGLKRYFKNIELQNLFGAEPDLLSCLVPLAWAYSKNFQKTPQGGSRAYPVWLMKEAQKKGSAVFLNSKVKEVIVENKTAVGVKVRNKNGFYEVRSKYVVAACDAETLFNKMLPGNTIPEKKKRNLENAKLYSSAVTVSVALDCPSEELGFGEENIFLFDASVSREDLSSGNPHKSGMHVAAPSVTDNTLAPKGQGTLTIFIPANIEDNHYWSCEKDEKGCFVRGDNYKKLKTDYAEILINRVAEKINPEIKKHILFYDVATPITYLRYTGNKNGTMMGQKPGKENIMNKVASYKTPVKNLLLSGHWADLGGGVLIAVKSAMNTSLMILKKENPKKFKQLAKYLDGKIGIDNIKKAVSV